MVALALTSVFIVWAVLPAPRLTHAGPGAADEVSGWESAVSTGKRAFEERRLDDAETAYRQALTLAEQMNARDWRVP